MVVGVAFVGGWPYGEAEDVHAVVGAACVGWSYVGWWHT